MTEVSAELGDPNCKLIEPYEIWEGPNLAPWLMEYTHDNEIMIRSEQILTMCEPSPKLLDKYKERAFLMRFYTNVQLVGNQFLVRGYDNGEHFSIREEYMPTLFVDSQKKSKYKTLEGTYVEPVQPGFVRDCRDFFNKYDGVEGFNIYGNERYIYQYISDKYPDDANSV